MKTRILMVSSLLITLALLFSLGAAAQMPDSPYGPQTRGSQPQALPAHNGQIDESFPHAPAPAGSGVSSASALNVDLGEPGLSFRYVQTFGETETAFLEDNNHFYYVEGLGVDGNNIWVTDSWSDRVLKFDSDGNFLQKIGKAGFRDATPTSLEYVTDVGVDTAGNIWVVDAAAAHVAKFDASGNHVSELGQTWNSGSDNNHFNDPIGIAFDGAGNIYVSDSGVWGDYGNHRVQIFDSSGSYLATLGQTGNPGAADDQFRRPRHIAIYGNLLYVADAGNHRVQVFNISVPGSPAYAATLGTTGSPGSDNSHFDFPEGVGADANYIYVADSNNHRVQVFSRTSYAYVATLGSGYGQGDYQFVRPTDVVADTAGRIYVADKDNKRVQQFDSSRVYQRTYGTTGVSYVTDGYHFYTPLGVAVGSDGSVHIVEERGHRLVKLNADGVPQWAVGEPGQSGGDNSHFFGPQDVAVDSHGRVYVVEGWGNDRVQIFNSDASYHATMGTGWGDGSYQFKGPNGIAVDATDRIYVADSENHRVQIYEPIGAYLATLGQTGTSGSGNGHFNLPTDVAVDSSGTIYVADEGNDRVQVFNSNRQYVRTIGQTGSPGNDFGRFSSWGPHRLAVDAQGRLYVSDSGNNRIQVFDSTGAYLTTISGSWGSRTGQFRGPFGLAVGPDGAVYVADRDNSRIQKFALGMPGWVQTNINGFGERANRIAALAPFGGHLYAGTFNSGNGAQLWRAADGLNWTAVITNGFGNSANMGMDHLVEFSGQLYAGTWADDVNGGEVWRSDDGLAWTQVVNQGFGDPTNGEVFHMTVFSGTLYAGTWSYTSTHGAEIWRSDTGDNGDWENVAANGLGDPSNVAVLTMEEFDGNLYAGIYSWNAGQPAGCEVWRTADGSTWTKVVTDGFGDQRCYMVESLASFQGALYAGTGRWDGGQIWRCSASSGCDEPGDWQQVTAGFEKPENYAVASLSEFDGYLYAVTSNSATGIEVWCTANGTDWEQVGSAGLGDSNNSWPYYDNSVAVLNNRLYIGTTNYANGGEIWKKTVTADFAASPTSGPPPLQVNFGNTSAGDYTTSVWTLGDGTTSTETNPIHTYDAGIYDVTLTVSDGVDTSSLTRTAYIRALYAVYLPLVARNYSPLIALYDDFDHASFDGFYNPLKWQFWGDSTYFGAQQQNGALVITNTPDAPAEQDAVMVLSAPLERTLHQVQRFEARLKISSDTTRTGAKIQILAEDIGVPGRNWWTQCSLNKYSTEADAGIGCDVSSSSSGVEYGVSMPAPAQADRWYTVQIEIDPNTAHIRFYVDGALLGEHTPVDAAALKMATSLTSRIGSWNGEANPTGQRYFDDVRITPARP